MESFTEQSFLFIALIIKRWSRHTVQHRRRPLYSPMGSQSQYQRDPLFCFSAPLFRGDWTAVSNWPWNWMYAPKPSSWYSALEGRLITRQAFHLLAPPFISGSACKRYYFSTFDGALAARRAIMAAVAQSRDPAQRCEKIIAKHYSQRWSS